MKRSSNKASLPRVGCKLLPDGSLQVNITGSHVPSFKNRKRVARGRLYTEPDIRKWMHHVINAIELELRYGMPMNVCATPMGPSAPSLMSLLPCDDRWTVIPEYTVNAIGCQAGEEGAEIIITKLDA